MKNKFLFRMITLSVIVFLSSTCVGQLHDNHIFLTVVNWDEQESIARLIDIPDQDTIVFQEGISSSFTLNGTNITMSDSSGHLLFCSNGLNVYNKKLEVMNLGSNLLSIDKYCFDAYYNNCNFYNGALNGTINAIPIPGQSNQYKFLYTTHYQDEKTQLRYALRYARVDMFTNDSLGIVIEKNEIINTKSNELPSIIKHANGEDWWIISADSKSDTFSIYLLNKTGMIGPRCIATGTKSNPTEVLGNLYYDFHKLISSPDGQTIISQKSTYADVFSFDRCSGQLTYVLSINQYLEQPNDLMLNVDIQPGQFSHDSKYYYYTFGRNYYQINMFEKNMPITPIKIGQITINRSAGFMKKLPSGKIALFRNGSFDNSPLLTMIAEPALPGHYCRPLLNLFVSHPTPSPMLFFGYTPELPNYRLGKSSDYSEENCRNTFYEQELTEPEPFSLEGKEYQKLLRKFK